MVDLATGDVTYIPTYGNNYTYSDFLGYGFSMFTNPNGHFLRTYDSADACGATETPYWYDLRFDVSTPDTTSVSFYARTADTEAGLDTAIEVPLGRVPSDVEPLDLGPTLSAFGQDPNARFLQVRVSLERNGSDQSPVFRSMSVQEYCQ